MRRLLMLGGAITLLAGIGLATVRTGTTGAAGILPYADAKAVERGQVLYQANCASCHGSSLEGEPNWRQRDADGYLPAPPHDASGHTWHHPDEQLVAITTFGSPRNWSAAAIGPVCRAFPRHSPHSPRTIFSRYWHISRAPGLQT